MIQDGARDEAGGGRETEKIIGAPTGRRPASQVDPGDRAAPAAREEDANGVAVEVVALDLGAEGTPGQPGLPESAFWILTNAFNAGTPARLLKGTGVVVQFGRRGPRSS